MTAKMQQVLDDVAAAQDVVWELVEGHAIRMGVGEGPDAWHCPLSWLAQSKPMAAAEAGRKLGLSMAEAYALADAADNATHDVHLRAQLLRACRLEPAS